MKWNGQQVDSIQVNSNSPINFRMRRNEWNLASITE